MAIFHCNISVVSRSAGHSAVAGAAYLSRSTLVNERDGLRHDFTRAHQHERLVADLGIALPEQAPERFADRSTLWNEVERIEKRADAQLCLRIEYALPDELPLDRQIELAARIVEDFRAEGMAVDCCIHQNVDGTNTHAHLLMPLRPLGEEGFGAKSKNLYLARDVGDPGRDSWLTADELKDHLAQGERLEKVYRYRLGEETRELTPSQAEGWDGCKRQGKAPVQESRRVTDWDDPAKAEEWRARIAERINRSLEAAGREARVDHRSYERQGVDRVPTLHEGSRVHAIEKQAQRQAQAAGREYQPVTGIRAENNERARANAVLARAREAVEAIGRQLSSKANDLAGALAREMAEWRARTREAARIIFQPLRPPSPEETRARQSLYRQQEQRSAAAFRVLEKKRNRSASAGEDKGHTHEHSWTPAPSPQRSIDRGISR